MAGCSPLATLELHRVATSFPTPSSTGTGPTLKLTSACRSGGGVVREKRRTCTHVSVLKGPLAGGIRTPTPMRFRASKWFSLLHSVGVVLLNHLKTDSRPRIRGFLRGLRPARAGLFGSATAQRSAALPPPTRLAAPPTRLERHRWPRLSLGWAPRGEKCTRLHTHSRQEE
jgi:hypothetical protein